MIDAHDELSTAYEELRAKYDALRENYGKLDAKCGAAMDRNSELVDQLDKLREAAGKVTCYRCCGTGVALLEHGFAVDSYHSCPDCADLRRLLANAD